MARPVPASTRTRRGKRNVASAFFSGASRERRRASPLMVIARARASVGDRMATVEPARARLQTEEPGWSQDPVDQAFQAQRGGALLLQRAGALV
jgi:hypothetical protein